MMSMLIMMSITFLDLIYQHLLLKNKNNNPLIIELIEIIESEEYDTDSVDIDLDIFNQYGFSNLSLLLNDDQHLIINQMIDEFDKHKSYVYIYLYDFITQIRNIYRESTHILLFKQYTF